MSDLLVTYKENKVIVSQVGYPTHTFRIVDSVPPGYEVWKIGSRHMPEGYLPLCRRSAVQPFPGGASIDAETLLAIKTDGANLILDAVIYGPGTLAEMERFIRKHQSAKPGSHYERAVKRMEKALPFMRQIGWK